MCRYTYSCRQNALSLSVGKHSCCWWVGCSGLSVTVSILVFDCLRNSLVLNCPLCRHALLQVLWTSILWQTSPSVTFCDLCLVLSGLWRAYLTICWTRATSSMAWHHWSWWRAWTCTQGSLPSSTCTGTAEVVSWVTSLTSLIKLSVTLTSIR